MVGAACLVDDGDAALQQRLGVCEAALADMHPRQTDEPHGQIRMIGAQCLLEDGKAAPQQGLRFLPALREQQCVGQRLQGLPRLQVVRPQGRLADDQRAPLRFLHVCHAAEAAQHVAEHQQGSGNCRIVGPVLLLGELDRPFGQRQGLGVPARLEKLLDLLVERREIIAGLRTRADNSDADQNGDH